MIPHISYIGSWMQQQVRNLEVEYILEAISIRKEAGIQNTIIPPSEGFIITPYSVPNPMASQLYTPKSFH